MSDVVVIIPTYNEIENIPKMLDTVMEKPDGFDVLVIDDNSPDGTAAAVRRAMERYPGRIHLLERKGKLGLGTAYILGFRWALERGYGFVIEMDADFSHNPDDLTRLYRACKEGDADMSIGSRYVSGVNVVNWPMGRVLMSYYASAYVRLVTGMPLRDSTAGFVCYRAETLRAVDLDRIQFKGYAFQIEMKFRVFRKKLKIVEIPIVFVNRVLGTSKMNGSIFGEAVFGVVKLRWKALTGKL